MIIFNYLCFLSLIRKGNHRPRPEVICRVHLHPLHTNADKTEGLCTHPLLVWVWTTQCMNSTQY